MLYIYHCCKWLFRILEINLHEKIILQKHLLNVKILTQGFPDIVRSTFDFFHINSHTLCLVYLCIPRS